MPTARQTDEIFNEGLSYIGRLQMTSGTLGLPDDHLNNTGQL